MSLWISAKRKSAESALKESERRLANIISFLPDATFVINNEGKVIAWNRAIEKLTGIKAERMLGKGDYEIRTALLREEETDSHRYDRQFRSGSC